MKQLQSDAGYINKQFGSLKAVGTSLPHFKHSRDYQERA